MASPGWAMVERVVDSVLESLPEQLRILCDRSGILVALEGMGAISLPLLSTLMEEDYISAELARTREAGCSERSFNTFRASVF